MFRKIVNWIKSRQEGWKLENWYVVSWDEEFIYRTVTPPKMKHWDDRIRWDEINRICFHGTDYLQTDELILFTKEREESYVIPMEATGGQELWNLILEKGLFNAELAIEAASSPEGLFCWPKIEDET